MTVSDKKSTKHRKNHRKTPWRRLAAIEARRDALLDRCFPLVAPGKGLGATVSKLSGSIYSLCHGATALPFYEGLFFLLGEIYNGCSLWNGDVQGRLCLPLWCLLLWINHIPIHGLQYRKYDGRSLHVVFGLLLLILLEISLILG